MQVQAINIFHEFHSQMRPLYFDINDSETRNAKQPMLQNIHEPKLSFFFFSYPRGNFYSQVTRR